jgi:hypothetical protein
MDEVRTKNRSRRSKRERVLYDRLQKTEDRSDHTLWTGERGVYVFKQVEAVEARRPVRQVFLNRTYLTGLFKTKVKDEYSGDLKEVDSRVYLVFKVVGPDAIEIYAKR